MFARRQRLHRRSEVVSVIRNGKRIRLPHVLLYIQKQEEEQLSRHTCVVGKKVAKSAVRRHRLQRWLRNIVQHEWKKHEGYNTVWVGLPSLNTVKSKKDLDSILIPKVHQIQEQL